MFSVSKVNDFMPTPLTLNCFCESCCKLTDPSSPIPLEEEQEKPEPAHSYQLFAAIMHLGATMASGHYVSFVRASDNVLDYCNCETHQANFVPPSNSSGSGGILKFLKPKVEKANISSLGANVCPGTDCCGVRMSIEQGSDMSVPEPSWLECDDDNVTVMTRSDFEEVLSSKRSKYSSLTPYLLFYVRTP